METVYLAGGCLWGVQAFIKTLPGVMATEAGRANGTTQRLDDEYDGYVECVKTVFNPDITSIHDLMHYLFEIIDPYSLNKQGVDKGPKYRTGVYSENESHLKEAQHSFNNVQIEIKSLEVLPLESYVKSADEHQDRLDKHPEDISLCHISKSILNKYN